MNHFVSDSSIQRMQYYPSGLPWRSCYHADEQPIINMQLEDEQNNKNSDIYVTFEQLY